MFYYTVLVLKIGKECSDFYVSYVHKCKQVYLVLTQNYSTLFYMWQTWAFSFCRSVLIKLF